MNDGWRLVVDVGGTNVRFGRSRPGAEISDIQRWPNETFATFEDALRAYVTALGSREPFTSVAIAAAGPAGSDEIALTNSDWVIRAADCRRVLGDGCALRLMNDLEAVAYALPYLTSDQVRWIDPVRAQHGAGSRMLAVNVGTGFGSAAIIASSGQWVCCPSESGHMRICVAGEAMSRDAVLGDNFTTVEDVLSGAGVRRLWTALSDGGTGEQMYGQTIDIADIFSSSDAASAATVSYVTSMLARTAANLALASSAWDGVFLCGSVALAWSKTADLAEFRRLFVGRGKMSDRLALTPIGVIEDELPAFIGLANVAVSDR